MTFNCMAGYKLEGKNKQQCRPDGNWSEKRNPTCEGKEDTTLFCSHLRWLETVSSTFQDVDFDGSL